MLDEEVRNFLLDRFMADDSHVVRSESLRTLAPLAAQDDLLADALLRSIPDLHEAADIVAILKEVPVTDSEILADIVDWIISDDETVRPTDPIYSRILTSVYQRTLITVADIGDYTAKQSLVKFLGVGDDELADLASSNIDDLLSNTNDADLRSVLFRFAETSSHEFGRVRAVRLLGASATSGRRTAETSLSGNSPESFPERDDSTRNRSFRVIQDDATRDHAFDLIDQLLRKLRSLSDRALELQLPDTVVLEIDDALDILGRLRKLLTVEFDNESDSRGAAIQGQAWHARAGKKAMSALFGASLLVNTLVGGAELVEQISDAIAETHSAIIDFDKIEGHLVTESELANSEG